ncbi:MAG: AMP-binding enzyme, partial [Dehalococcoidia bacterium]
KDTIASGDRVVYSPEVEDVISMRPTVLEVAVIGVPDEELGEVVKAVVVVRGSKEITKEEIADWCKGKIEDYKMPKLFDFVDSLPKNPGGKVLKTVLRERYSK